MSCLMYVANQFLSKLGDVTLGLEQTNKLAIYQDENASLPNIQTGAIGIGNSDVWYGNPDARIKANESHTVLLANEDGSDDEDCSSDGENVVVEAKKVARRKKCHRWYPWRLCTRLRNIITTQSSIQWYL